ncbi:GNAT family N-acetyltransferase [Corynebacterium glutamicum]|uniref:GNAT family N-acetyltransferase n=1 Tax=Corynebacterium glutamicum TaxID=1718 RepID=UPI001B8D2445|nr:GNAT family N-acetyltransferase [Corynebacterium glutamicum]
MRIALFSPGRGSLGRRRLIKRVLDTTLIVISAPLVVPVATVVAVLVKINLGSPVLFRQNRIGLNDEEFSVLKFRSMLPEIAKDGRKLDASERVTPFGALLRRSSLDELPQLLNVLRGDMSLVGPRPLFTEYLPYYSSIERARHDVRPGITGLSQVSGRNNLGWDERLSIDVKYVEECGLLDDFRIIKRTLSGIARKSDIVAEPWTQGEYLSVYRSYPKNDFYALRRFEPQDIEQRVRWMNDPRTRETLTVTGDITVESTEQWLKNARRDPLRKDFSVFDRKSSEVVAIAGYRSSSEEEIPVFYFAVDPDQQGKRIGSTTLELLIEFMRAQPGVSGAAGEIYVHNIRSIKIHERLGFEFVEADLPDDRVRMELRW